MNQRTIWKYPLNITDRQVVMIPKNGQLLSVQFQGAILCLWVLVDPNAPEQPREIEVIGTGNPIDNSNRYHIDTVQDGSLVWHIFERESK